jgi:hypothetical protein
MGFRAANDNPIGTPIDNVQVVIRVGLGARAQGAIAFDIGLRHRDRQIVTAAVVVKGFDAAPVGRLVPSIDN